jgi:GT2 family glycosyltransferase
MDISIIIINYNTYQLTCDCVASVMAYTAGLSYEIILVDNASPDGFDAVDFSRRFPQVKLILSPENLGFAGGNNLGIREATGEYILLLNSDTYLKDNAVKVTRDYLRTHPEAAVVSARLIYPDGRHQSVAQRFPSIKYQLIELLRLQKLMSRPAAGRLLLGSFFEHRENVKADWVWGAWFMFPRSILQHLPGNRLDDTYFMYFEDMQWCMDIRNLGYEIHFCADAEVVHLMGGSSGAKKDLMKQNELLFLQKNYTPRQIRWIKRLNQWLSK